MQNNKKKVLKRITLRNQLKPLQSHRRDKTVKDPINPPKNKINKKPSINN